MKRKDHLMMNEAERKLFENTKAFVAKTCPKIPEELRVVVVARVYDQMRFVLTRDPGEQSNGER